VSPDPCPSFVTVAPGREVSTTGEMWPPGVGRVPEGQFSRVVDTRSAAPSRPVMDRPRTSTRACCAWRCRRAASRPLSWSGPRGHPLGRGEPSARDL